MAMIDSNKAFKNPRRVNTALGVLETALVDLAEDGQ